MVVVFGRPRPRRDFLFRRESGKTTKFLVLSHRAPQESPLFDVDTKSFAPALAAGDILRFSLFANPAVNRSHKVGDRKTTRRHDVVMDALSHAPPGARAERRGEAVREAGRAWLERKGEAAGFKLADPEALEIDGYDQFAITRGQGRAPISISVLNFEGLLTIVDPETFLCALAEGFGRARAFGCGLMLIRRA